LHVDPSFSNLVPNGDELLRICLVQWPFGGQGGLAEWQRNPVCVDT